MNQEQKDKIFEILEKLRLRCYKELHADEASNILLKISSLYGTVIELSIDAQMDYNRYYEQMTDKYEKVTEARARAKASDPFEQMLRMEGKVDVIKELIRSLKYLLKVKLDEKREGNY